LPFEATAPGPNDPPQTGRKEKKPPVDVGGKLRAIANHMEAARVQVSRKTTAEPTQQDPAKAAPR
jgi:hypothetical protein